MSKKRTNTIRIYYKPHRNTQQCLKMASKCLDPAPLMRKPTATVAGKNPWKGIRGRGEPRFKRGTPSSSEWHPGYEAALSFCWFWQLEGKHQNESLNLVKYLKGLHNMDIKYDRHKSCWMSQWQCEKCWLVIKIVCLWLDVMQVQACFFDCVNKSSRPFL